jgi:hypothetical protein
MEQRKTKEQFEAEMLRKAAAVEAMTQSDGWKALIEFAEGEIHKNTVKLAGKSLDENYARERVMWQAFKFFFEVPKFIRDRRKRDYILSQGTILGLKAAMRSPAFMFEWMAKGNQLARAYFEKEGMKLQEGQKQEFHQSQLK